MQTLTLHGALGAAAQFDRLLSSPGGWTSIHTLDFYDHGRSLATSSSHKIPDYVQQVHQCITDNQLHNVCLFGYSMGGYVAMQVARLYPHLVARVITLATKYTWSPEIAAKEVAMLNADKIEAKVPALATALMQRHKDWRKVLAYTAETLTDLGEHNYLNTAALTEIQTPVLLLSGDSDKMVPFAETVDIWKQLPNAQLGILPGTPHQFENVDITLLTQLISNFIR